MISFDTNILVYATDRQAGARHERAAALVGRAMRLQICLQPLQTFCEFFNVATRKLLIDPAATAELLEAWGAAMTVEAATRTDLDTAMRGVREYKLSFWDAMIWATIRRAGSPALITEDLQDGQMLEGVRFIDPFVSTNEHIIERLMERG